MTESSAIAGCLEACRRSETVAEILLDRQAFLPPESIQAVGAHIRHCTDHFLCFFNGLETGVIDYDARTRERAVESDPREALRVLGEIAKNLSSIGIDRLNNTIRVSQSAAPDGPPAESSSTVERELAFLSGHAIHHLAILVYLSRLNGFDIPEDIGVAYSTGAYRATLAGQE